MDKAGKTTVLTNEIWIEIDADEY